jgi:hypothetical protein
MTCTGCVFLRVLATRPCAGISACGATE